MKHIFYGFLLAVVSVCTSQAQVLFDAEADILSTVYNRIQISGKEGTRFDATDLDNPTSFTYRFRLGYRFNDRHNLFVLAAPLKIRYIGSFDKPVRFHEGLFMPFVDTEVTYVFNSYRLTYRYDFLVNEVWRVGAGLTAKVRDAYIETKQDLGVSKKTDLGIVPLINLYVSYKPTKRIGFLLEGDGLVAPNGRAFDFELASFYALTDHLNMRLGYRVLEGGGDGAEVYNFTFINYGVVGLAYNF